MASFSFQIKSGRKGKAVDHAAYIAREGRIGTGVISSLNSTEIFRRGLMVVQRGFGGRRTSTSVLMVQRIGRWSLHCRTN